MKSSIQIHNELRALDAKIAEAQDAFNAAEGDARDAYRDAIGNYKGQQAVLNDMLGDVLSEEDKIRKGGGVPLAEPEPENKFKPVNVAQMFLGDPAKFHGLNPSNDLGVMKQLPVDEFAALGVPAYEVIEREFPRQTIDSLPYFGIADSLPKGTTDADVMTFFERDAAKYKLGAKAWKAGEAKGKTEFAWKKRSAYMETIAHYIPVLEPEMKDYGQLQAIINTELLYGLRQTLAAKVVNQKKVLDTPGIEGLTQIEGVQKYTKKAGDTIVDSIRRMKTDVMLASGYIPTHIAVHPYVSEQLELEKDANGRYKLEMVNGKLFGLTVVDDLNLVDDGNSKYGLMVYWNGGATVFTKHNDELAVGLVNDQFIRNEFTIRAEGTHGLKVTCPQAFSYLADTGITRK